MGDPTISETISVLSFCQKPTNVMLIKTTNVMLINAHKCDAFNCRLCNKFYPNLGFFIKDFILF